MIGFDKCTMYKDNNPLQPQHFGPEILAPVGGLQQLYAAVRSGADAVYFGLQGFNARRNAENFGGEDLRERIEYCHERGVRVNITVNTLVLDSEMADMQATVDAACSAGADALIVQDLAVAEYAKKRWPGMALHASTQMAAHNAEGVRMLQEMGFKRVVLARELSLAEIGSIYDATGAELEVFVHGAHCMSVSGLCYLSSMIGGRSGNRGLCAQPCRLDCSVCGRDHALSLKDLSYISHINELADAGVASFKIEGRMKRPEYVAASVEACRAAVRGETPDMETLRAVFSRSGFTDGYLTGRRDLSMFGYRTKEDVTAAEDVLKDLAKTYEKEPQNIPVDMLLYVQEGEPSQLSVSCSASGLNGSKSRTDAAEGEAVSVTVLGPVPQLAKTLPISEDFARRSLSKTGGTPYYLRDLTLAAGEGLMLPSSALNELRRSALEELKKERIAAFEAQNSSSGENASGGRTDNAQSGTVDRIEKSRAAKEMPLKAPERRSAWRKSVQWAPQPIARFERLDQLFSGCPKTVILPLSELTGCSAQENSAAQNAQANSVAADPLDLIRSFGVKHIWAEIPAVIWPSHMETVRRRLANLKEIGIYDVVVDNIGAIELAKEFGFTMHGGMMLNVLNSRALKQYLDLGLEDCCLSFELAFSDMRKITASEIAGAALYGYLPLMKLRACPLNNCAACGGSGVLTDRMGEDFTIICRGKQYAELLNCVPMYVGDRSIPPLGYGLLYFTTESAEECAEVFSLYKDKAPLPGRRTAGLYFRDLL